MTGYEIPMQSKASPRPTGYAAQRVQFLLQTRHSNLNACFGEIWLAPADPYPTFTGTAWTPPESGKADLQLRRKQSLTGSATNLEAVNQTMMPVFLAVRLLGSVRSHSGFGRE